MASSVNTNASLAVLIPTWDPTTGRTGTAAVNVPPGTDPVAYASYLRLISGYPVNVAPGTIYMPPQVGRRGIAASEQARVWGDPHVEDADGGKFDFQGVVRKTYNLLNDTGLTINAKFQAYKGDNSKTTMGEIGAVVSGPNGTSIIKIDSGGNAAIGGRNKEVSVNGYVLQPNQSVTLADGGTLTYAADGNSVTFTTREGYKNKIDFKQDGFDRYLDYTVASSSQGVDTDGRMPGGIVGQTFDADNLQRNGKTGAGAQGEGAIEGKYTDYEVPGGIYGMPQTQILKPGAYPIFYINDPIASQLLGIPLGANPSLVPAENIRAMWDKVLTDSMNQSNILAIRSQSNQDQDIMSEEKLTALLTVALQSGNIDLAMLLMSGLETKQANKIAGSLLIKIQKLQEKRRDYATQMGAVDANGEDKQGDASKEVSRLNTLAGDVGTEISLLQTFLQDVMSQKKEAQQMASNMIKSNHDTAQSIVRNIG